MSARVVTIETMQEDHRNWLAAHAQWRRDIERWKKEHEAAVGRLEKLQKIVREHGECLDEHARAFLQVEKATGAHEREIASYQAGKSNKPQDVVANHHREQEGVLSQHAQAHERIKTHHEAVMAQLAVLESAAAAAM